MNCSFRKSDKLKSTHIKRGFLNYTHTRTFISLSGCLLQSLEPFILLLVGFFAFVQNVLKSSVNLIGIQTKMLFSHFRATPKSTKIYIYSVAFCIFFLRLHLEERSFVPVKKNASHMLPFSTSSIARRKAVDIHKKRWE